MTFDTRDLHNNPPSAFNGSIRSEYLVFQGSTEEEPGYGVKLRKGDVVVYAANFYKDTAARITQLLTVNPQREWDELEQILSRDAYSITFVTLGTADKEVSPGRKYLAGIQTAEATLTSISLGAFKLEAAVDADGHLTVIVKSLDGSPAEEIDTEVGCADDELGFRFTTQRIEQDQDSQQ
jgi:hypothetical protein